MGISLASPTRGVLTLFHNINRTQNALDQNIARLASGFRINRAADDPGGLVVSEKLRAQLASLEKTIAAQSNAANVLNAADAALAEVNSLLSSIRESVIAAQDGAILPDALAAEQQNVNDAIAAINNIAQTTQFGTLSLLNGKSSIGTSSVAAAILDLDVRSARLGGFSSSVFTLNVSSVGTRATDNVAANAAVIVAVGDNVTLDVTGPLGTAQVVLATNATAGDFLTALNSYSGFTGVIAVDSGPVDVFSQYAGSDQELLIEQTDGLGVFFPGTLSDTGTDLTGTVNGVNVFARGNDVTVVRDNLNATLTFDDAFAAGNYNFTVRDSGLSFSYSPGTTFNIGISPQFASLLGNVEQTVGSLTVGGTLESLQSGGANDLYTDPGNALNVVDAATSDVLGTRAFLGSTVSNLFESSINSMEGAQVELEDAISNIVDLDYAQETSDFTRNQILQQVQIAALASSNLLNGSVLDLLKTGN